VARPERPSAERSHGSPLLRRLGIAVLMLVALLAIAGPSRGADAQSAGRESTILLTVAGPPDEAAKLEAVAGELLERLAMRVELRRVARIDVREIRQPLRREPAYFARVWIAFSKTGKARLYLEHSARDRVLLRDVTDDSHNPELVREELGHILQTAVDGLKAGEEIGEPRGEALKQVDAEEAAAAPREQPTAAPPAKARPEPPAPRQRSWRFGPRYELVWLGDGYFEDGPGAVFGAALPASPRFGLELSGFFRRPIKIDATPVGARLQSLAVDALLSFEAWRGARARLRLAAGVEADFVRVSPFAASGQDVQLANSHWLKLALGRLTLTYAHDIGNFMAVEVTAGAELDPGGTRYVFQRRAGTADVLSPWPARPLLSLGATVP
jgi:hypothetical protein